MALFIYMLAVQGYAALIRLFSVLGHQKARQLQEGRRAAWQQLKDFNKASKEHPVAWFHCASLGEFEQGRPVIEAFKQQYPHYKVLLTFFSPSGYEVRKNYAQADLICYLPADSPAHAKRFLALAQPSIALFVKYEFWHYYLKALHQNGIPIISFASIFRREQLFFKSYGGFYRKTLSYFTHLFVQQEASKLLLEDIGITRSSVASDTRFDRVHTLCQQPKPIPVAARFAAQDPVLIIGSAWLADLEVISAILKSHSTPLRIILAPHEIDEGTLQGMERLLSGMPQIRFSQAQQLFDQQNYQMLDRSKVLLIDNIGMLSSLYQYGNYAYIGGAFGKGLHNTLEAATFGLPIIFGPKYHKFQEAIDLIECKAAFSITSAEGFHRVFGQLSEKPLIAKQCGEAAAHYVNSNLGGTQKILSYIQSMDQIKS